MQHASGQLTAPADLLPVPQRQLQSSEPRAFMLLGFGNCLAAAFRPLRGRSRRDVSHAFCREHCGDDNCIGYSYSPCQRVCTIHGDPAELTGLEGSWSTLNGGGRVAQASGQCGASCYVRMGPCAGGTAMSNGASVQYGEVPFGQVHRANCPQPWVGVLTLRCELAGISVLDGRCSRPCQPGTILDRSFLVPYPAVLHGEAVAAPCPQGTQGAILLDCIDEYIFRRGGRCGYNCPGGAIKAGEATVQYPDLNHDAVQEVPCPQGYGGKVTLECVDSLVTAVGGRCDAHCQAGQLTMQVGEVSDAYAVHGSLLHGERMQTECLPLSTVGGIVELICLGGHVHAVYNASISGCHQHCPPGVVGKNNKAVSYGTLQHGQVHVLPCGTGPGSARTGNYTLRCEDGAVEVLSGDCTFHCVAGHVTSNSINVEHDWVPHGGSITLACPNATHTGVLDVTCNDGAMLYNGSCGGNCNPGSINSSGHIMNYPFLKHKSTRVITCAYPWAGVVTARCYDTRVVTTGSCGVKCPGGQRNFGASAAVSYQEMVHLETKNFSCAARFVDSPITFSGKVLVSCYHGKVSFDPNADCYVDCPPGSILNNGARVAHPKIFYSDVLSLACSPSALYGTVNVICVRGLAEVSSGSCGAPCMQGTYNSVMTRWIDLSPPVITHDASMWLDCPGQLSGRIHLSCFDGVLRATEGNCGERCAPAAVTMPGALFTTPALDHAASFVQPCERPFNGIVNATCNYGNVNTTSNCIRGCFAVNLTLEGGASVSPPQLEGYERVTLDCPSEYLGSVVVECRGGTSQVVEGACHAHCAAGRWQPSPDALWDLPYLEMMHGNTTFQTCPAGMTGSMVLRCDSGQVVRQSGGCFRNCVSGRQVIRQGVTMRFRNVEHGVTLPSAVCPSGFVGSVRLRCWDGVISVAEGVCHAHCQAGGVQGAPFGFLLHNENASLVCPIAGVIKVTCHDGVARAVEGKCARHCEAGEVKDNVSGIPVAHGAMGHQTNGSGTCVGNTVGYRSLRCEDGQVRILPREGELCARHCPAQEVTSSDGSRLSLPALDHLQRMAASCPDGKRGSVVARCFDAVIAVVEGQCGDVNCAAGKVLSGIAEVANPAMNNGKRGGPAACPGSHLGEAVFLCGNGSVSVVDVTAWIPPWDAALTSTSAAVTTTSTTLAGFAALSDDHRFLLCGCCLPPPDPAAAPPVPGIDYRAVLYWAAGAGAVGIVVAGAIGFWWLRPKSWKKSRVAPKEAEAEPPSPRKQEMPALAATANVPIALKSQQGLRDALALEDSPRSPTLVRAKNNRPAPLDLQELDAPARQKVQGYREGYEGEWRHW